MWNLTLREVLLPIPLISSKKLHFLLLIIDTISLYKYLAEREGFSARGGCLRQNPRFASSIYFPLAEREGFEPPVPLPEQWFSRPPHSTALPSLRVQFAKLKIVPSLIHNINS